MAGDSGRSEESVELAEVHMPLKNLIGIFRHARRKFPHEVIGFLFGRPFRWDDMVYTEIWAYAPSLSLGSRVFVSMQEGTVARSISLVRRKYPDAIIVGWYHSHPGHSVFMSETDVNTHVNLFNKEYHVALVVDPSSYEFGFFKVRMIDGRYRAVPVKFRIWRELV